MVVVVVVAVVGRSCKRKEKKKKEGGTSSTHGDYVITGAAASTLTPANFQADEIFKPSEWPDPVIIEVNEPAMQAEWQTHRQAASKVHCKTQHCDSTQRNMHS